MSAYTCRSETATVAAVDPIAKTILQVPAADVIPTAGLEDYLRKVSQRDLSLCCLFQQGRCRADTGCRQLHANRAAIAQLRAEAARNHVCCPSCEGRRVPGALRLLGRATATVPLIPCNHVVPTKVPLQWRDQPAGAGVRIAEVEWQSVCRLQLQGTCKYGSQCRNVHLCPRIGKLLLAKAACTVNVDVPASLAAAAREFDGLTFAQPTDEVVAPIVDPMEAAAIHTELAPPPTGVPTPQPEEPVVLRCTSGGSSKIPLALRANFPRLNEESLSLRNADLDGLVFCLPTFASASSTSTDRGRTDLFSPSPIARG